MEKQKFWLPKNRTSDIENLFVLMAFGALGSFVFLTLVRFNKQKHVKSFYCPSRILPSEEKKAPQHPCARFRAQTQSPWPAVNASQLQAAMASMLPLAPWSCFAKRPAGNAAEKRRKFADGEQVSFQGLYRKRSIKYGQKQSLEKPLQLATSEVSF